MEGDARLFVSAAICARRAGFWSSRPLSPVGIRRRLAMREGAQKVTHQQLLVRAHILQRRQLDSGKQVDSAYRAIHIFILGEPEPLRLICRCNQAFERPNGTAGLHI